MDGQEKFWFPAKRYGFGWGLPTCWEGWVVLVAFVASEALVFFVVPPREHPAVFLAGSIVTTALLVAVVWIKGEPIGWRWGNH
jgi:hypothetical protein